MQRCRDFSAALMPPGPLVAACSCSWNTAQGSERNVENFESKWREGQRRAQRLLAPGGSVGMDDLSGTGSVEKGRAGSPGSLLLSCAGADPAAPWAAQQSWHQRQPETAPLCLLGRRVLASLGDIQLCPSRVQGSSERALSHTDSLSCSLLQPGEIIGGNLTYVNVSESQLPLSIHHL